MPTWESTAADLLARAFPGIRPASGDEIDHLAALDLAAWNRFILEHTGESESTRAHQR